MSNKNDSTQDTPQSAAKKSAAPPPMSATTATPPAESPPGSGTATSADKVNVRSAAEPPDPTVPAVDTSDPAYQDYWTRVLGKELTPRQVVVNHRLDPSNRFTLNAFLTGAENEALAKSSHSGERPAGWEAIRRRVGDVLSLVSL